MPEPRKIMGAGQGQTTKPKSSVKYEAPTTRVRAQYETPSTNVRTNVNAKRMTEAGQSKAQTKAILEWEEKMKNRKTEDLIVVDENGNVNPLGNPVVRRTKTSVTTNPALFPPNAIVTHNHPWDDSTDGTGGMSPSIGISLSAPDIGNAIRNNNKEKRAATRAYIYSIKRPANGWGELSNPSTIRRIESDWEVQWRSTASSEIARLRQLRKEGRLTEEEFTTRWGRMNVVSAHRATKYVANKYGFSYTRRKR